MADKRLRHRVVGTSYSSAREDRAEAAAVDVEAVTEALAGTFAEYTGIFDLREFDDFTAGLADADVDSGIIPAGTYYLDDTIVVPPSKTLIIPAGVVLRPIDGAMNILQIKKDAKVIFDGGIIDVTGLGAGNFTGSCLYVEGEPGFGTPDVLTRVSGFRLRGPSTGSTGKGIHLYSATGTIFFCQVGDGHIRGFDTAIHVEARGTALASFNYFRGIHITQCRDALRLERDSGAGLGSNVFAVQWQASGSVTGGAEYAIWCEGDNNHFEMEAVDVAANSIQPFPITFTEQATGNTGRIKGVGNSKIKPTNSSNNMRSEESTDDGTSQFISPSVNPPGNNSMQAWAGNQDDMLVHANQRFTVTQTAGSAPTSGALADMFSLDGGAYAEWLSGATFPVQIEVAFGAAIDGLIRMFGLNTVNGRRPRDIQCEVYRSGAWAEVGRVTANAEGRIVMLTNENSVSTLIEKVRWTIHSTTSDSVRIERLWAFATEEPGYAYLPRTGGAMHGAITGAILGTGAKTGTGAGAALHIFDGGATNPKELRVQTAGSRRWGLVFDGSEAGSDSGTDAKLEARSDAGALLHTIWNIVRATGATTWNKALTMGDKLTTVASTVTQAGFRLPQGTRPTTPTTGDIWLTSQGVYAQVAGVSALLSGGGGTGSSGPENIALRPTGVLVENISRNRTIANQASILTSGRLHMYAVYIPENTPIAAIGFTSGTTALSAGTNQWFALYDAALLKLACTVDDGATAWAQNTLKSLAIATDAAGGAISEYVTPVGAMYYVGICVVASTPPSLKGNTGDSVLLGMVPAIAGGSTSGLTTPATAPSPAGAITAFNGIPYIQLRS